MIERVDLMTIAAAVGRHPRRLRDWLKSPVWPKGMPVGKGGRMTWRVDELPDAMPRHRGPAVAVRQAVILYLAASGGQLTPAGVPSPVDTSPAATGAGGLPGGGGVQVASSADSSLIGELVAPVRSVTESEAARIERARKIMAALQPLLMLPDRHRGRRAMAELIGKDLGCSFHQVYRYARAARAGGLDALVRLGGRADRGVARVAVSKEFQSWAEAALF